MDYGYQLLRHVVQQVFGNLRAAVRLTLLLTLLPSLLLIFTNPAVMTGGVAAPGQMPEVNWGMLVLVGILSVVAWCWAAVGWHRYVLLEEYGNGIVPQWNGGLIGQYFIAALIVGLVVLGAAMGVGIVIGIAVAVAPSAFVAGFLGIGLVVAVLWVSARVGLILPAAAVGKRLRIGESWAVTAPVSGQILLPVLVIAIVGGVASQVILLAFGPTIIAAILNIGVSWLQLLVNLALMTTLYGNLIEGRQMN